MTDDKPREALETAHHELTTLHGLFATDGFKSYDDALDAGCDQNGAWDVFVEDTWCINVLNTLKVIEAALADSGTSDTPPEPTEEMVEAALDALDAEVKTDVGPGVMQIVLQAALTAQPTRNRRGDEGANK